MTRADAEPDRARLAATIDDWRRRWRVRQIDEQRERDEPWSLPLVVRLERVDPPTHDEALRAAAASVVALLSHPSAAPDGPWHDALARWSDGWIRKVVRRARAGRWTELDGLPGVTASTSGGGQARAMLPHPMDAPPPAIARLQVAGLDLDRETAPDPEPGSGPVLTIAMAPGVAMTTGKAAAQAGHAAQVGLLELDRATVLEWAAAGHPLRIRWPSTDRWRALTTAGDEVAIVQDGGFTEIAPGTLTAAATFYDVSG